VEQIKSILILGLVLIAVSLYVFRPSAPYEPPVWIETPAVIGDSLRKVIINEARQGYLTVDEARRFEKIKWRTKYKDNDSLLGLIDSLRIQGVRIQPDLTPVSILTDSVKYRLSKSDSSLGVGFDAVIGLSDTAVAEPYNLFIHNFWLDSLTWRVQEKEEKRLTLIELVVEYPKEIAQIALLFLLIGVIK